jgi:hypothetical protein
MVTADGAKSWCAFFYRIHLLALETVTIAAYYAWFGYFDMLLGNDGHVDDVAFFNEKAGTNFSAFAAWVILSTVITAVTHAIAFTYAAEVAFELADLHYGDASQQEKTEEGAGGFGAKQISVRYSNMTNPRQRKHDHLWSKRGAVQLLSLMGTCPAVFAWDWTAKVLLSNDETVVWLYCAGVGMACVAATSTLCIATSVISFVVRCCRKAGSNGPVLKHGQKMTTHSCMTILLHNCALLTGLAVNYAIDVSIENSDKLDDHGSITIKWAVTAVAGAAAVTVLVFHQVVNSLCGCLKRTVTTKGSDGADEDEESVGVGSYIDHALIYIAAISLFESVYYSALKSAPSNSSTQYNTLITTICVMFLGGSAALHMLQRTLEYTFASVSDSKSASSYIEHTVEFLVIGYSYVLGKMILFTISHWLKLRADTGKGHGLMMETVITASFLTVVAFTATLLYFLIIHPFTHAKHAEADEAGDTSTSDIVKKAGSKSVAKAIV